MAHFFLELDEKSVKAITDCVHWCMPAKKLHLTLIHTRDLVSDIVAKDIGSSMLFDDPSVVVPLSGIRLFDWYGGTKVWVLKLAITKELATFREHLEWLFTSSNLSWSKEWPFNPHVTVCDQPLLTFISEPPEVLTFTKLSFHPGPKAKKL